MIPDKSVFLDKWIPALPQGSKITTENAARWYDKTVEIDPTRFEWHYNRLKGLGGSDVGEIATWKMGELNIFKTPWDIIKEKLCIHPIQIQNNDMRRGSYLEPVVQKIFLEDFKAQHIEEYVRGIDNTVSKKHPWMRGNVDDVVKISSCSYIVDYKCPSDVHHGTTILPYAAQVHQYDYLFGLFLGKPEGEPGADGMLIAQFDYPNGSVDAVEIAFDPMIMQAVLNGGDEIWNHILNGTFPEASFSKKEDLEYSEEEQAEIHSLEDLFIRQKLISDSADAELSKTKIKLTDILTQKGTALIKNQKMPIEILTISTREKIKEPDLLKIISQARLDIKDFQKEGSKIDQRKMESKLEELGCDLNEFIEFVWDLEKIKTYCDENNLQYPVVESVSQTLRTNKKTIDKDALIAANEAATRIVTKGATDLEFGNEDVQIEIEAELLTRSA